MSSNEVVKSVAKKLKYYFEIKRLEDGFDLSDVHQPQLDHPPLKVRPALRYEGLHDRALKHYFSQPDVRVQLTQLNGKNAKGALHGKKEVQMRRLLDNYMRQYNFQKTVPSCYSLHQQSVPCTLKSQGQGTGILHKRKKQKNLLGGYPTLRSVPSQHVSKGEAARLVNSATKILVASSTQRVKPEELSLLSYPYGKKGSKRPSTSKKRGQSAKEKGYNGTTYIGRTVSKTPEPPARPRSPSPSQSSSTVTSSTASSTTTSSSSSRSDVRPRSSKFRSRTIINAPETRPQEEVNVKRFTQTDADYDVGQETDRQLLEKFDKLEEEVTDGPWCEYQVYVCTGNRIGASTKAPIKLTMYGEKGRTKEFALNNSKRHKIPFQKGREDLFILPAHHIGRIRKIQIGHDRPELNYAWYLEGVTIFDMHARRIFQFPCERWLSGQDGDKKSYRILQVDREKDFIDALDDSMTKSPRAHLNGTESESSSTLKEDLRYKTKSKPKDNYSTNVRPSGASDSDSDSSDSSSITTTSKSSASRKAKVPVNAHGRSPRQRGKEKKPVKDDYDDKAKAGTVITLHAGPDARQVDEIYMDPRGRDAKVKPAEEFMEGYKAALTASEQEKKKSLEREREMERSLLQGKSIHDAIKDGDMERVKELLHHFPEMRDFRDESSWTPVHIAASRGDVTMLRWLLTSDADINAETSTGYNAMHVAAMNGHANSMILLQAMGASILGLTSDRQSALHLAAKNGHLECVKWLVANRAPLTAEDRSGRTPFKLAEDFRHGACADFLRVCMRELSDPKSSFAQMHGRGGGGLQTIEEDASSSSSKNQWKDDIEVKGHTASDSEDENKNKKHSKGKSEELKEKRRVYKEQHQQMDEKGISFLDSIRQEVD